MKSFLRSIGVFVLMSTLFIPLTSYAAFEAGDSVFVGSGEVISSNLFAAGTKVEVLGEVMGDAFVAGEQVEIAGTVHGNVFVAARNIFIKGTVLGSVYAAGTVTTISGSVKNNVYAAGEVVEFSSDSVVGLDVVSGANVLTLRGTVNGDVQSACENCLFAGTVKGNVLLQTREAGVDLQPSAVVEGNFEYTSPKEMAFIKSQILGKVIHTAREEEKQSMVWESVGTFFFNFGTTLLLTLCIWLLMRKRLGDISSMVSKYPWQMIGLGLVSFLVTPVVMIILVMTLVGIPLATLLAMAYFSSLLLVYPITSILLGDLIVNKWIKQDSWFLALLVGAMVLSGLRMVPFVSDFVFFASIIIGLGTLILVKYQNWKLIMNRKM